MIKIGDLFNVCYGVNLELNALERDENGINFVSRTAKNNGVSAKVKLVSGVKPIPAGTITVAGGGSVMESFLQPEPYYSGRDLYFLVPRVAMSDQVKLYYCACIRANKYRYNYGRQANRTLRDIYVPHIEDIPSWVLFCNPDIYEGANTPSSSLIMQLEYEKWRSFKMADLFTIKKGKRLTKANMIPGMTPFIGAVESNNGVTANIGQKAIHDGNTISVSYNGSVAEAFYQPVPFWATDDVNVLYPFFDMTPEIAMFICTIIRAEKYRFNYGRKWHLERMRESVLYLPSTDYEVPDWEFMHNYIKTLPYSTQVEPFEREK